MRGRGQLAVRSAHLVVILRQAAWPDRVALRSKLLDKERSLVDAGHPDDLCGDPLSNGAIRWVGKHRAGVRSHPLDGQLVALKSASRAGRGERIGIATALGFGRFSIALP